MMRVAERRSWSEIQRDEEIMNSSYKMGFDGKELDDPLMMSKIIERKGVFRRQFEDEELGSSVGYHSGYARPIPITDQIDILRGYWPDINPDLALKRYREIFSELLFPNRFEGAFALIRPGFFSDQYGEELKEILKALEKERGGNFVRYCSEQSLGPVHLAQTKRSLAAMMHIKERQPEGDIIIICEQFGIRHRGRSVRRADAIMESSWFEFDEGAKNVGTMLLTHTNRLAGEEDLWVICPGDRFCPDTSADFSLVPVFGFAMNKVRFTWIGVENVIRRFGAASGYILD